MIPKFKLHTLFVLVILLVSQGNPYVVNAGASGRLANALPSEDHTLYIPLVLNAYTSLIVTSVADVVNGDTSSPGALIANPGADGISLREAITAANNGSVPLTITFSPMLAGQTIAIASPLFVTGDGITLTGLSASDGQPNIILDASGITTGYCCRSLFFVDSLDFTLTHVRIIGVTGHAIEIRAGQWLWIPPAPSEVRNIRIEDNVFDNTGVENVENPYIDAIRVWTNPESIAKDCTIENVRITGNTFRRYKSNGVILGLSGTNNLIRDVTIQDNQFIDTEYPIELSNGSGTNNRIQGTKIIGNTIIKGSVQLFLSNLEWRTSVAPSSGNVIADTLIWGNMFSGYWDSVTMIGGQDNATGNTILNVQIINNLIEAGRGIHVVGGKGGASGNHVEGVQIVNNTVITPSMAELRVDSDIEGSSGNIVTGVSALNTIFRKLQPEAPSPEDEIAGEITVDQVKYSITSTPGFAGINGNLSVDPKFINPIQGGNFHLQPGSPAIDAGTSAGAPASDLECLGRFDDPATPNTGAGSFTFYDIGAFEFNGLSTQCQVDGQ